MAGYGYGYFQGGVPIGSNVNYNDIVKKIFGDSIIAFWPLQEKDGNIAYDVSGNGRNAAYNNITLSQQGIKNLKSVYFDGSNSYINLFSTELQSAFNTQNGTISIIVKATENFWANGNYAVIFRLQSTTGNRVNILKNPGGIEVAYAGGGISKQDLLIQMGSRDNINLIITFTWDKIKDEALLYLNGARFSPKLTGLGLWTGLLNSAYTIIGQGGTGTPTVNFIGYISHPLILNRVATPLEVKKLVSPFYPDVSGIELEDINEVTAINASTPCITPTYDGSGQCIHPSVIDFGQNAKWNGYRYWMAMTPFAGSNDTLENPSILASSDGDGWIVPDGLTNPITQQPASGYNADTELVFANGKLYCFYLASDGVSLTRMLVKSSIDGINWSDAVEIISTTTMSSIISPSIIYDNGLFKMWTINNARIELRTSLSAESGWSAPYLCPQRAYSTGLWHFDVIKLMNGNYLSIVTDGSSNIYLLTSNDGRSWYYSTGILMTLTSAGFDKDQIYRPTIIEKSDGGFDFWYSGRNGSVWRTGRTNFNLP